MFRKDRGFKNHELEESLECFRAGIDELSGNDGSGIAEVIYDVKFWAGQIYEDCITPSAIRDLGQLKEAVTQMDRALVVIAAHTSTHIALEALKEDLQGKHGSLKDSLELAEVLAADNAEGKHLARAHKSKITGPRLFNPK